LMRQSSDILRNTCGEWYEPGSFAGSTLACSQPTVPFCRRREKQARLKAYQQTLTLSNKGFERILSTTSTLQHPSCHAYCFCSSCISMMHLNHALTALTALSLIFVMVVADKSCHRLAVHMLPNRGPKRHHVTVTETGSI
jgi:hypothetical protein